MPDRPTLTLVTRAFCPLCDEFHADLQAAREGRRFTVRIADVDADPQLLATYDTEVPVLLGGDGREVCRHRFDVRRLVEYLDHFG